MNEQLQKAVATSIEKEGVAETAMSLCSMLSAIAETHGDITHADTKGTVTVKASVPNNPKRAVSKDSVVAAAHYHLAIVQRYREYFTTACTSIKNETVTHSELDALTIPANNMISQLEEMLQAITRKKKID